MKQRAGSLGKKKEKEKEKETNKQNKPLARLTKKKRHDSKLEMKEKLQQIPQMSKQS